MVVTKSAKKDLLETVLQGIREAKKMNVEIARELDRISVKKNVPKSRKPVHSEPRNYSTCCSSTSCVGEGVLELLQRQPSMFTFQQACAALMHCSIDVESSRNFVQGVILNYSMLIVGLPECPNEDLQLAVFFFVEDVFGIRSKFELCVRCEDGEGTNAVGVVFESLRTKRYVQSKLDLLEGTEIEIEPNYEIGWIVDGFCPEQNAA